MDYAFFLSPDPKGMFLLFYDFMFDIVLGIIFICKI